MFIFTGLFKVTENEAQLAGVMAHEMSHVILRHGTHEASKANLIQLPLALAGAATANSILGQVADMGLGLAANGGQGPQFLSDHPNPGNRERAIEEEIRTLPRRDYGYAIGEFARAKAAILALPAPAKLPKNQ